MLHCGGRKTRDENSRSTNNCPASVHRINNLLQSLEISGAILSG
jgi:hypothetical protein